MTLTEQFKQVTGYDIGKFFNDYITFTTTYYQNILNYYKGADIDKNSFEYLDYLKKEATKIEPLIDYYGDQFNTTNFWDLNNNFAEIQTKLMTCDNMGRWQRSSRVDRYSSNLKLVHIQKQNETLEKISIDAGFSNQDSWTNIAIQNLVNEEDYTNKGGKLLNISLPNSLNSNLENVIDFLIGDNLYGKDLNRKLQILPDGGVLTLEGKESLYQIFETIMKTIRGSIPEFPEDGISSSIFGVNENIIQYPMIFRSLLSMIQKDKRFKSLELLDIKKSEDSVFLEFQATTIVGDNLINNIII